MPVAPSRRAQRGMTLIEVLVVLLIIGILATIATLSVGLLGEDREIERETTRLSDAIALLQEQAQLEGRDYGIVLETTRYEFQRFDAFEQRWVGANCLPTLRSSSSSRAGPCCCAMSPIRTHACRSSSPGAAAK
jgi:type II secretion system protein H